MMFLAPTDPSIDAAGRWFLQSGIQEAQGGVARYYRSDLGQNAPVSTEITGYTLSALLFLYQRTGGPAYLEAGLRAARFLTRVAWDAQLGTFPFELPVNGVSAPAYFFDCGIIVRGLLYAWRITKDIEFRDAAIAGGRAMLADFPSDSGLNPILLLPQKRPRAWEPRWSASPGCYQLKSALAWQELFEVTGDQAFSRGYESALEAALDNYPHFLPGDPDQHQVMDRLHPYSYFLEGLLPVIDRPDCAAAFRIGVDRAGRYLREIAPSSCARMFTVSCCECGCWARLWEPCRSMNPRPRTKPGRRRAFKSPRPIPVSPAGSCLGARKVRICPSPIRFQRRFVCRRSRYGMIAIPAASSPPIKH